MNIVALSGRAVREIDLRYTSNGKGVANGTLAVQRKFKNAQGEYQSDFIDFIAWGKTGELMAEYIKKGDFFGLTGEIQTRIWEKDDGTKVKITEINVNTFDFPVGSKSDKPTKKEAAQSLYKDPFESDGQTIDDSDLPF